ncbi:methyltransferase, partial [Bacillus thuringiensis]|nr:methyltransferase [Bacillus thuringiensis]
MKKKQRMIVTAAMAATLATGALPTTSAFAAETKAPIQQQ